MGLVEFLGMHSTLFTVVWETFSFAWFAFVTVCVLIQVLTSSSGQIEDKSNYSSEEDNAKTQ